MKIVAIIQARLTSTRLPGKVLMKIKDKTIIQHVVDNVNESKLITDVVVAIPYNQDIPFTGADKFEGNELDVLDRYYKCARAYNADTIVRITSDCPLINAEWIDFAIGVYTNHRLPYIKLAPVNGLDVEVFSYRILQEAWTKTDKGPDREHVTPYMQKVTKLSVDDIEDLERVKKWVDGNKRKV